jgi:sugar lactone lactonase YvrE
MSDDLELRAIDRRHEPDPRFVAELGDRLEAILATPASARVSADGGDAAMVELEPEGSDRPRTQHGGRRGARWLMAAACVALVIVSVLAVTLSGPDGSDTAPSATSIVPDATGRVGNGWLALDSSGQSMTDGGDIYLVRPGEAARELEVAGSGTADDSCPTWSPDGTRLSFGRLTGPSDTGSSAAELVIVPVARDGSIGAPRVIPLDGFEALPGFDPHPCATWAPEGRWVAFAGSGEVWVADTSTGAIRRLPGLRPTDLEWRPGTDELMIAGDIGPNRSAETSSTPVTVYVASTGELRQLGSVRAANLTWSPDGSTLAYQGGENDTDELWLVDADGTDQRLLTHVGNRNHGIGPIWSPTGERVAYQRLSGASGERHEIVLVNVGDGTETVIEPPKTEGPDGPQIWYPDSVTWSPDGTTLLITSSGVVAVLADAPGDATVLDDTLSTSFVYDHAWVPVQMWGRIPASRE